MLDVCDILRDRDTVPWGHYHRFPALLHTEWIDCHVLWERFFVGLMELPGLPFEREHPCWGFATFDL